MRYKFVFVAVLVSEVASAHKNSLHRDIDDASALRRTFHRLDRCIIEDVWRFQPGFALFEAIKAVQLLPFKSIVIGCPNRDLLAVIFLGVLQQVAKAEKSLRGSARRQNEWDRDPTLNAFMRQP